MKKFFDKMKNYSFWVSFSGALIILLNAMGKAFGFSLNNQVIEEIILAFAGVLVVFGIVTMDVKNDKSEHDDEDEKEE